MRMLGMVVAVAALAVAGAAAAQDKVIYHFDSGLAQATKGLRNIRNHLEVDPKAKIVVVAHADGVDFLMTGVQDANKNPYNVIGRGPQDAGRDVRGLPDHAAQSQARSQAVHPGG